MLTFISSFESWSWRYWGMASWAPYSIHGKSPVNHHDIIVQPLSHLMSGTIISPLSRYFWCPMFDVRSVRHGWSHSRRTWASVWTLWWFLPRSSDRWVSAEAISVGWFGSLDRPRWQPHGKSVLNQPVSREEPPEVDPSNHPLLRRLVVSQGLCVYIYIYTSKYKEYQGMILWIGDIPFEWTLVISGGYWYPS